MFYSRSPSPHLFRTPNNTIKQGKLSIKRNSVLNKSNNVDDNVSIELSSNKLKDGPLEQTRLDEDDDSDENWF